MNLRAVALVLLVSGVVLTAVARSQEASGPPKTKPARPKLTESDLTDLKLAHYEVERMETKYQPYIITYDDQELAQLVYDTRKEAQARVDEINAEDRLDKLGVEGKQNKKVGIREVKRTYTEHISADSAARIAKELGVKGKAKYQPQGKRTHCSEFVRDFARELLGKNIPELDGQAGKQADQLKAAAGSSDSKWRSLSFSEDPATAFQNAQMLADEGKLVVVIWKNPHPTGTDTGHIAVVVPSPQDDGGLFDATGRKWKMMVPYIAQAGDKVSEQMPLGDGFGPAKKAGMEIYVLSP